MMSGMMRKFFAASSGWPGPNNSPASDGSSQVLLVPVVLWISSDALTMRPAASVCGVPSVM